MKMQVDVLETTAGMFRELSKEIDRRVTAANTVLEVIDINDSLTKPVILEITEMLRSVEFYG